MSEYNVALPSKPRVVKEEDFRGVFEIDGLYPGYGHTLGNSLRRIILSSLPGSAITSIKIAGADHEFSTLPGVKEDVINIILNLKKIRVAVATDEPQIITIKIKGPKDITGADIQAPGQVTILTPELHIASLTDKNASFDAELTVERGLGYVAKEVLEKDRVSIGSITPDAIFTPIRRVNYEVENMRVGNRTDFNRLRITIETDGTLTPTQALERSIEIMIIQLKAIVGFKEDEVVVEEKVSEASAEDADSKEKEKEIDPDILKTRIETVGLSLRTANALTNANIRTVGGLARKKEEDIFDIDGLGSKGVQEIKRKLAEFDITLK